MWEDFLNDECDIYHLQKDTVDPGYGMDPQENPGTYTEEPDLAGVKCHFGVKSDTLVLNQHDPYSVLTGQIKLALPLGTDIRMNDRVVSCGSGITYTVRDVPRTVHDHHVFALISRADEMENAV